MTKISFKEALHNLRQVLGIETKTTEEQANLTPNAEESQNQNEFESRIERLESVVLAQNQVIESFNSDIEASNQTIQDLQKRIAELTDENKKLSALPAAEPTVPVNANANGNIEANSDKLLNLSEREKQEIEVLSYVHKARNRYKK